MASDESPPPGKNPFAALREKLGPLPPGPVQQPSPPPKLVLTEERPTVRRERAGRGGKTVTIAEGPAFAGRKLDELARDAARAMGVGARVEGATLVLQGDQAERLVMWLATRGFARVARGN